MFYDIVEEEVQILAIITKAEAQSTSAWATRTPAAGIVRCWLDADRAALHPATQRWAVTVFQLVVAIGPSSLAAQRTGGTMPTSQINGIRIHWEITGDAGDPMVLVHGSWGDHKNWARVVPDLSRSFRVLTYDRRGHSRSERPSEQGSVRDDVADLAALLEELGHSPANVVGNSFGAAIVLRLAAERPDMFRSMIVHEPPLFGLLRDEPNANKALATVQERIVAVASLLTAGDGRAGARQFVETIAFGPGAWQELPAEVRETFVFNAPTWLDEVNDPEALKMDLSRLRSFAAPALLTVGDQSPPFFQLVVDLVATAMPQPERWTYHGAGHVPHLSHPDEYTQITTEFITRALTRVRPPAM